MEQELFEYRVFFKPFDGMPAGHSKVPEILLSGEQFALNREALLMTLILEVQREHPQALQKPENIRIKIRPF